MRLFKRCLRSSPLLVLHLAFAVILAGGVITWLTAKESNVTLPPSVVVERFGVTLELLRFETEYYPGGVVPRDYVSYLRVNGEEKDLRVNRPLKINGCRVYQQGYTPDGCSIVKIRKDAAGTAVTFTGYVLFFVGGLWGLLRRRGSMVLAALSVVAAVSAAELPTVSEAEAEDWARRQVVYRGRVTTFSTVAHDVMKKIHSKDDFRGLEAERAVASLMKFPDQWADADFILCGDGEEYVSFNDCFDDSGRYVLRRNAADDERVGLFALLRSGELYGYPGSEDRLLSSARVEGEIVYNSMPLTLVAFVLLLVAAAVSFFCRGRLGRIVGWTALAFQLALIVFESLLRGYGPFASLPATLQFLAAAVALLAMLIRGVQGVGLLAAGCMALVVHLQASNPMITPLMPVLHSPWLSLHVSLVMLAYSLFVIIAILAMTRAGESARCRGLLRVAVYLLGLGICTGAVWANESWGRYWGWDPKETWALITFLIYSVPLHLRCPSRWWYIVPLLSVAMTYFGVNYMQSLHSYG